MLREMSSDQLFEWIAYYQLEPWGMASMDYMIAHFKALFVNAFLKKGKRPHKVEKFLTFGQKKKPTEVSSDDFDKDWQG